jgi:hypothetical protein
VLRSAVESLLSITPLPWPTVRGPSCKLGQRRAPSFHLSLALDSTLTFNPVTRD